jgi:formylglycine-generating enzyme
VGPTLAQWPARMGLTCNRPSRGSAHRFQAAPWIISMLMIGTACGTPPEPSDATAPAAEPGRADGATQADGPRLQAAAAACPDDMQSVSTDFCPDVERRCLDLEHERTNHLDICHAFARDEECRGARRHVAFCIDTYEYPNRKGAHPVWMLDWFQAQATCESKGKRLCWASEWTAACEGPDHTPFPYGFERDHNACNFDNFFIDPVRPGPRSQFFFYSKDRDVAFRELSRLDQSVPSGSMDRCRSGFGIYDMTGNLDEWVVSDEPTHDKSKWAGLKGGGWGHVRSQCRPMTTSHEPGFYYYFVGFRCCKDAIGAEPLTKAPDAMAAPVVEAHDYAPDPILPIGAPGPSKTKFTWVQQVPQPHPRPRRLRLRHRRGRLTGGRASGSRAHGRAK